MPCATRSRGRSNMAAALNATDPDLSAFRERGGKLILFHGWSDAAIPAVNTINYYRSVVAKLGQPPTDSFVRTYIMPGVQHCSGGPGADTFGVLPGLPPAEPDPARSMSAAMVRWVEQGIAPSAIIATKFKGRTPAVASPSRVRFVRIHRSRATKGQAVRTMRQIFPVPCLTAPR